jgi:hypothetical protein
MSCFYEIFTLYSSFPIDLNIIHSVTEIWLHQWSGLNFFIHSDRTGFSTLSSYEINLPHLHDCIKTSEWMQRMKVHFYFIVHLWKTAWLNCTFLTFMNWPLWIIFEIPKPVQFIQFHLANSELKNWSWCLFNSYFTLNLLCSYTHLRFSPWTCVAGGQV